MSIFLETNMIEENKKVNEKLIELPEFTRFNPDFEKYYFLATKYQNVRNLIIVGRGGSVTSFKAMFEAIGKLYTTKKVFILDTNDPEYITYLKIKCSVDDTLMIIISKSGNTVDVIEDLIALQNYKKVIITENKKSTLKKIRDIKELEFIEHPPIGGRFSAITPSALVPATIIYIDTKKIVEGMKAIYESCKQKNNLPLKMARILYDLEKKDYIDVFVPLYGYKLKGFDELIMQLMHETVCKNGLGQNFLVNSAPECQHHTNQRVFGGRKNLVLIPHAILKPSDDIKIDVPYELGEVKIKNENLKILNTDSLQKSLLDEFKGVCDEANEKNIPMIKIIIDKITPYSVGELIGFWQMTAIYSAILRGVNPYDQPEVEGSKKRSFDYRTLEI